MQKSFVEKLYDSLRTKAAENALPLLTAFFSGLIAYSFCFVHKLEIHDDLNNMFSQGYPVSSGRWGLAFIEKLFPTVSIPWFNGLVSLLLISVAVCLIVRMFAIRKPLLQFLLSAVLAAFPSQMTTFAYMFTTIQYAVSLLLSVTAAYCLTRQKKIWEMVFAGVLLVLSLSIYQPYVAVCTSLLIVWCFSLCLSEEHTGREVVTAGLRFIVVILLSMLVYYGILVLVKRFSDMPLNEYAENNLNSISDVLHGILVAYTSFAGYFLKGHYDIVRPGISFAAHLVLVLVTVFLLVLFFSNSRARAKGRLWAALLCLFLLPLGINCLRLISSLFHNLMTCGFVSFYVLVAVVLEYCLPEKGDKWTMPAARLCTDFTAASLAVILISNVYFANAVYLDMYMQEEQAKAFYQGVVASLTRQEDFDENSWVVFFGEKDFLKDYPLINTDNQAGIKEGIIQTYSQDYFIKYFLGLDLNTNSLTESTIPEGWDDIIDWEEVISMPSYPYSGSIRKIAENGEDGKIFFVRLGK